MPNIIEKVVDTIGKIFGFGTNLTDPKQAAIKEMKRLKYQLEAAQNYIFVDERSGQFALASEGAAKELKIHFRKQAFDSA